VRRRRRVPACTNPSGGGIGSGDPAGTNRWSPRSDQGMKTTRTPKTARRVGRAAPGILAGLLVTALLGLAEPAASPSTAANVSTSANASTAPPTTTPSPTTLAWQTTSEHDHDEHDNHDHDQRDDKKRDDDERDDKTRDDEKNNKRDSWKDDARDRGNNDERAGRDSRPAQEHDRKKRDGSETDKAGGVLPTVGQLMSDSVERCSGTVIESKTRRLVLTATQCVYSARKDNSDLSGKEPGWINEELTFVPGRAGDDTPYGEWVVDGMWVPPEWIETSDASNPPTLTPRTGTSSRTTRAATTRTATRTVTRPAASGRSRRRGAADAAGRCQVERDLGTCKRGVAGRADRQGGRGASSLFPGGALKVTPGGLLDADESHWQQNLDLNLMSAVRLDRHVVPLMVAQGHGSVVHVSSGAARHPAQADGIPYAAAKAALNVYRKGLANEVGPSGVRVVAVLPGLVETESSLTAMQEVADHRGITVDELRAYLYEHWVGPLGRPGRGDEAAELIAFLASSRSSYLTGTQIAVDGGIHPTL
jgi:NAD(P)-dependent dehydrogenase (short-subunit alcohol dehydrogenase family)